MLAVLGIIGILLASGYCVAQPSPYYGPYCFQNRYGVLQAGFIPFATGGFTYFYRSAMRRWLSRYWKWVGAALLGSEALITFSTFASVTIGPFLGVAMMLALVVWRGGDGRPSPAADFIGRASYHLFIAHMSIAAILVVVFAQVVNSFQVFASSVAIALVISGFLVPLEWRLNRLRACVSRWGRQPDLAGAAPGAAPASPAAASSGASTGFPGEAEAARR